MQKFNDYVLQVIETYPTDGSYTYSWVDEPNYVGITKDLCYKGDQFVTGDPARRSYCSGITFEVFFQAYLLYNQAHNLSQIGQLKTAAEMEDFRLKWYGTGGDRRTIKHALVSTDLGDEITDLAQIEKGDFAQIWRHNGSGHTVIFIEWVKDESGEINGFIYWSSNKNMGPGYRAEYFGKDGSTISWEESFFMKIKEPIIQQSHS